MDSQFPSIISTSPTSTLTSTVHSSFHIPLQRIQRTIQRIIQHLQLQRYPSTQILRQRQRQRQRQWYEPPYSIERRQIYQDEGQENNYDSYQEYYYQERRRGTGRRRFGNMMGPRRGQVQNNYRNYGRIQNNSPRNPPRRLQTNPIPQKKPSTSTSISPHLSPLSPPSHYSSQKLQQFEWRHHEYNKMFPKTVIQKFEDNVNNPQNFVNYESYDKMVEAWRICGVGVRGQEGGGGQEGGDKVVEVVYGLVYQSFLFLEGRFGKYQAEDLDDNFYKKIVQILLSTQIPKPQTFPQPLQSLKTTYQTSKKSLPQIPSLRTQIITFLESLKYFPQKQKMRRIINRENLKFRKFLIGCRYSQKLRRKMKEEEVGVGSRGRSGREGRSGSRGKKGRNERNEKIWVEVISLWFVLQELRKVLNEKTVRSCLVKMGFDNLKEYMEICEEISSAIQRIEKIHSK